MQNNKGIVSILIVSIVMGVLVLGGGVYYFSTKKVQTPIACTQEAKICPDGSVVGRTGKNCEFAECPETKKSETTDFTLSEVEGWKTYINTEYGFEMKYPNMQEFINSEEELRISNSLHGSSIYDIAVYPNPQNLSLQGFFINRMENSRGAAGFNKNEIVSEENIIFGEQKIGGVKIVWDENISSVLVRKDDSVIIIQGDQFPNDTEFSVIFNQMLSTFRFLNDESLDVFDWQTYANTEYGFEFKYPTNFSYQKTNGGAQYRNSIVLAEFKVVDGKKLSVSISENDFLVDYLKKYAPTGSEEIDPKLQIIGQNNFYYYGAGGGGVCYPDQYFISLNKKILIFKFSGCDNDKTPSAEYKKIENQILSTFKFVN